MLQGTRLSFVPTVVSLAALLSAVDFRARDALNDMKTEYVSGNQLPNRIQSF
ncbi:hypothetical protein [Martelella endophytica]|uniref:hypothetical protein n=1 Tax=Martelella endophytica TaxID=1486262 RepID=UPI000A61BB8D|nr:hypothetical protein [Martelella endophytica]